MKTKRLIALILVSCLFISVACAEEEQGGSVLDAIGGWFGQAWEDSSKWVSQAWTDASSWVSNAWGDASKWVGQAWNDSATWATGIWGDVSTWAVDTSDSVSAWWTETFNSVSGAKDETWSWINKEQKDLHDELVKKYKDAILSAQSGASSAGEELQKAYAELLGKLKLNDTDISKVIDTIKAYAAEKGITAESMEQILLPYLMKLVEDSTAAGNGKIPAIAVAQYLTGIAERLGISNEEQAQLLITGLDEILNAK